MREREKLKETARTRETEEVRESCIFQGFVMFLNGV